MGVCHGGVRYWLDRGDGIDLWGCIMGAHDWIGMMELICGGAPWGVRHWLDLGDGIDLWGCAMGACDWMRGGGGGDGIDLWGCAMGARDTG